VTRNGDEPATLVPAPAVWCCDDSPSMIAAQTTEAISDFLSILVTSIVGSPAPSYNGPTGPSSPGDQPIRSIGVARTDGGMTECLQV
jgi:hypothetical protein